MIGSICVLACCAPMLRKYPQNYAFLFGFTIAVGVLVGFLCAAYTAQSVILAVAVTFAVFASLTVYAWNTSTDFTGYAPYIFAALSCLIFMGFGIFILSLCGVQFEWLMMLYDVIGVLIFSFYIVFDTQLILGEWGGHKTQFSIDDYVFASLNLYMDIINLFLHILSLMGDRE